MNKFIGVWRLLPQFSKYDIGVPPINAKYVFKNRPEEENESKIVDVLINWTDVENKVF